MTFGWSSVTGANGSGKSSLYRALRLLADIAQGRIAAAAGRSQVIVITHAAALVAALTRIERSRG